MSPAVTAPAVDVELGGAPLPATALRSLVRVDVEQILDAPAQAEVVFGDPPGPLPGSSLVAPGVALGLRVDGDALFDGEVAVVEQHHSSAHDQRLVVRGYDHLDRLRRSDRSAAHVDLDLAELAATLAGESGLSAVTHAMTPRLGRVLQCQRSDLDLLRDLARRTGLHLLVRGTTLHLLTLEGEGPPVALQLGERLLSVTCERGRRTPQVRVTGWEPVAARGQAGAADAPRQPARRPDTAAGGERAQSGLNLADAGAADAVAQALLDHGAASAVVAEGVSEGSPAVRPGVTVTLDGVDAEVAGSYLVTAASHRIDAIDGYVTSFSSRPPTPHEPDQRASLTLGTVLAVDDPDGLGRVRVALPAYDDLETGWLGVVSSGAGPSRGIVALPDVDDRVAVLFPRHDPGLGVVLGGLFGTQAPPDSGVEGDRTRRMTLTTPAGCVVRLDDHARSLTLEDPTGSRVDLGPDGVTIRSAGPLDIAAPGEHVRIRGARIDLDRA